jgi:hypothetical protein
MQLMQPSLWLGDAEQDRKDDPLACRVSVHKVLAILPECQVLVEVTKTSFVLGKE